MKTAKSVKAGSTKQNPKGNTRPVPVRASGEGSELIKYASNIPDESALPGLPRYLLIKGGQLYLGDYNPDSIGVGLWSMVPSRFSQCVAWCRAVRSLSPQNGSAEVALLEYAAERSPSQNQSRGSRAPKPELIDPHEEGSDWKLYSSSLPPEISFPGLERQLFIRGHELCLGHSMMRGGMFSMVPCTFVQAVAWAKAIRALAPQRGFVEEALLDYAATYLKP